MRSTMWTYPWDVLDVGVDTALDELTVKAGVGGLSLATAYHAGRFLQPRSPRRSVYFPEDGTIYFHPDVNRYENLLIKPKVARLIQERGDVLRQLEHAREKRDFALNSWTVCLHNTRIGMEYPQVTTVNAFGDRNYYNLCPSNPDARAYVTTLVADLTRRYALDSVELESPNFMGFAHEFHHEKDGVGLTAKDDFLLSLCFCDSCMARARAAGVDAEAARRTVRRWLEETLNRPIPVQDPDFVARGVEGFRDTPEVYEFLRWRFEPVTSLTREIREAAHPRTQVYFLSLLTSQAWLFGIDFEGVAQASDGVVVCAYDTRAPQVGLDIADARARIPQGKYLATGLRVFYPEVHDGDELRDKVQAAAGSGTDGFNFYNYGLIPPTRHDWVRQSLASLK
ncbi:MAG: hypothetical protein ACM3ZA_00800 [Bacillota bacterium]